MEQDKIIREPKQVRSIKTKEKILEAALQLFCSKGYYKTTTNEIAKLANVSIGSLYSYYKDKDTIFLEILSDYHKTFSRVYDDIDRNMEIFKSDPKAWLRHLFEYMIRAHETSIELNKEMNILCYTKPEVAKIREKNQEKNREITLEYFHLYKNEMKVDDIEAASIVVFNLIDSVVDQIVFSENKIDNERILKAGIDAVYKYLME